jgi:hypothetical protein
MSGLQTSVKRAYTTGFPGQLVEDGPKRARVARINSATLGTDPGASTNRISRAFGYASDIGASGSTYAAREVMVNVGGPDFFGILGHPQRYALYGSAGNSLAASVDLPQGAEGEFFDMATGLIVELFNETTGTYTPTYGDQLCYVPAGITPANNPLALPYGALFSIAAGAAVPTGMILIPNARVVSPLSLAASAVGALVSGSAIVQLTQ